jgi:hypothetical protein
MSEIPPVALAGIPERSTQLPILGWVLIVSGILFIFLGFAGALREVVRGTIGPTATRGAEQYARLIEAVADLIRALTAAPQWLLLLPWA